MGVVSLFVLFLNFYLISCTYTPGGDDVQAGSVLLPATRRGRYLANIVRRQAVDGTGIKFNKDADRINAESKKKVDVLSEELLPYIIAEQERRTTLYKRIMTAIQNGEKGVTIAEIRNKPPLLVRKGFLYRCPSNRAPKEPDGSGSLMCEDDIVPTQVMYDSCLSAEDKELYVAENKYFFCNRHRVEGPDLPRNGTTVIGCAPIERTSLNYTTRKCALEDSDDVVVHYRYYPDRSYKYVTELDPDREVCEHWNPCQVGYIYSLPSPDQAQLASELWKDSPNEYVPLSSGNYTSSPRRVDIPSGYMFDGVVLVNPVTGDKTALPPENFVSALDPSGNFTMVTVKLGKWSSEFAGEYQAQLKPKDSRRCLLLGFLFVSFMKLICSLISMSFVGVDILLGQMKKKVEIPFKCNECRVINIMIRCRDKNYYNVDPSKYVIKKGSGEMVIIIEIDGSSLTAFGDYFCVVKNENGVDENIKIVTVNGIQLTTIVESVRVGGYFDRNLDYICGNCTLKDIVCNGESVMSSERISSIASSRMINFNFPRFEPSNACVYVGLFKDMDKHVKKNLAVLDTVQIKNRNLNVPVPKTGEMFEVAIRYTCSGCIVEKVLVNGIPLDTIPADNGPQALYHSTSSELVIRITEFSESYEGAYQAIFNVKGKTVVKTVMIIRDDADEATTVQTTSDHPIGPTGALYIGPKKALVWSVEKSADGTEPSDGTEPVSGETTAESTAENTVVTGDSTGENTGETTVEPSRA